MNLKSVYKSDELFYSAKNGNEHLVIDKKKKNQMV